MLYNLDYIYLDGVHVFLESRQTRLSVGILKKSDAGYQFTYDKSYLNTKKAIPLGPECPLTRLSFQSEDLFPSFEDRIPPRNNPEYPNYCKQFGLSPEETDSLILLVTIGQKGPSSFIFEPLWKNSFTAIDLKEWRQELDLTTRDFANAFGISQATLVRVENGKASGSEVLKLLEILYKFPEVALDYVKRSTSLLHSIKKKMLIQKLESKRKVSLFHTLTSKEVDFTQECVQFLTQVPWGKPMIENPSIQSCLNNSEKQDIEKQKIAFFKIRFARAICYQNLEAESWDKESTPFDFKVYDAQKKSPQWLIGLTHLHNGNKSEMEDGDLGIDDFTRNIMAAQSAILNKISMENSDNFLSFQEEENSSYVYRVILMNISALQGGFSDIIDHLTILKGYQYIINQQRGAYASFLRKKGKGPSIQGLFEHEHGDYRCQYIQQYIHAIGFIKEEVYKLGEINKSITLYPNPHLKVDPELLQILWPLRGI